MFVLSISRWRKKLAALLAAIAIIAGLGVGISRILGPNETVTTAPTEDLQKDVLSQPVQVQGAPATEDDLGIEQLPLLKEK